MFEDYPDVLNTKEAMEILDITKNLLYSLLNSGEIKAFKIGKRLWRIPKENLIKYVKEA